jgi:hypothetical protein
LQNHIIALAVHPAHRIHYHARHASCKIPRS